MSNPLDKALNFNIKGRIFKHDCAVADKSHPLGLITKKGLTVGSKKALKSC